MLEFAFNEKYILYTPCVNNTFSEKNNTDREQNWLLLFRKKICKNGMFTIFKKILAYIDTQVSNYALRAMKGKD